MTENRVSRHRQRSSSLRSGRLPALAALAALALTLAACGSDGSEAAGSTASQAPTPEEAQTEESTSTVPDLTGVWDQSAPGDSDTTQQAIITDSTITIYWVPQDDSEKMLYWAGTYEPPTSPGSHSWTSINDRSQTDSALLASGEDSKEFTYDTGVISYEVGALGETWTVSLEQSSTTIPAGSEAAAPAAGAGSIEVVEAGMGGEGAYVWVTAMVRHEGLTGEFATVLFNVFDTADVLIASAEQVEQLTTAGTTFPIGTQVEIPSGSDAARVEATVSVSDYGATDEPMPVVEPVAAPASAARFEISNTSEQDWANPRIQIACRNDAGILVGGGMDFPNMIPAGGQYLVPDTYLLVSPDATTCEAYVQLELAS